jgi:hypothetical protein
MRPFLSLRDKSRRASSLRAATAHFRPKSIDVHAFLRVASFLLNRSHTPMRLVLTLSGLMLLCASVVTGAGTFIDSVEIPVHPRALSEPAGLVALGSGFVLLANQVRRKKC